MQKTIIQIQHYDTLVKVEIPADAFSDIFEVATIIKGALIAVGWQPETINEVFK